MLLLIHREVVRGLSTAGIFKYVDSVAESFISCISLILASFIVAISFNKRIPYPFFVIIPSVHKFLHVFKATFYLAVITLCIATYLYEVGADDEAEENPKKQMHQQVQSQELSTVPDSIEMNA